MPRIDPEKMDAITERGYNPRNIVYLPFDKDPLNIGSETRTLGMTLPEGSTWERMSVVETGRFKAGAKAVSDFINENFTGEDREYMQANAQYVNAITLIHDEAGPDGVKNPFNKIETEKHEVAHTVVRSAAKRLGLSHIEQEIVIRLGETKTGNPDTQARATGWLKQKGFTPEQAEEKYGPQLQAIINASEEFNKAKREEVESKEEGTAASALSSMMRDLNEFLGVSNKKEGKEGED